MIRYRAVFLHALFLGFVACGGNAFTAPGDEDGGTTAVGSTSSGTSGSSTGSTTATTTGSSGTGSGSTVATTSGTTGTTEVTSSTSATTGSGGSGGAGGGGGSAGAAGSGGRPDAGPDAASCDAAPPAPVQFRMRSEGGDYCINYCQSVWVTIFREGSDVPLAVTHSCTASCSQCQPIACPAIACIAPQHLKPEGETYTWDGTLWEQGHCGPQMIACISQSCGTPKGKYIARMCAYKSTSDAGPFCMSASTQTCVDVPFDYPTAAIVEGVLK